jgi:GTP diphosphokinase / guanosine-3',5'-bis(diphosphate) 3'-diphosphatase
MATPQSAAPEAGPPQAGTQAAGSGPAKKPRSPAAPKAGLEVEGTLPALAAQEDGATGAGGGLFQDARQAIAEIVTGGTVFAEPVGMLAALGSESGSAREPESKIESRLESNTGPATESASEAAPVLQPGDRAASHLAGTPAAEIDAVDHKFQTLLATVHTNRPGDDLEIIRKAWQFCLQQHEGQKRASGEPYIIHPLEVAQVLAELKMDSTAIAAGLLHDAVEDTDVTSVEIARRFNDQVAHIVEGVTKLDKIKFANREDHQAENIRKMLLAMVTDVRVVIIKLADRLHNMRTLEHLKPEKQQKIARETLDIYAPLAHRLGMGKLRGELEDLAFRYTDPYQYSQVESEVEALRGEGESFLNKIVAELEQKLAEHKIEGRVESRIKRLYSIQQKLASQQIPVDQVYDLFAIRVICNSVQDCYALLGLLHSIWRPVPGRIKDFIAMPRPNLYQSLHTTLIAPGGHQFEVQIRTEDMHRVAEEGIAAHWKYKASDNVTAKDEARLAWVRQLMEWQREMTDPNEFMSTLKIDLYPEEVYTFTPKGKVVVLPKDASPIDFAYTIHTEVGNTTIGAKVNGRIVPLRTRLRNGDIVEISTQAGHAPSRDWLSFTKSSRARNKIKHWINEHQRERAIEIGKKLLEREARKFKLSLHKFDEADYVRVAAEYGLSTQAELLAGVGFGKYSTRQVLNKLEPGSTMTAEPAAETGVGIGNAIDQMSEVVKRVFFGRGSDSLQVEGQDDLLVYRARCCNPIRGEEIIGYVTRGKGVAVHARSCPNVQNLLYESDRRIQVEWAAAPENPKAPGDPKATTYPVKLTVLCEDRAGLLKEFTAIISDDGTNIRSVDSKPTPDGNAVVDFVIETVDVRHLNRLVLNLRKVPGVRDVHRVQKI